MACDPLFSDVAILLHTQFSGSVSQPFTDSSSYARSTNGGNTLSNGALPLFGNTYSIIASGGFTQWNASPGYNFSTNHTWTVERQVYRTGNPNNGELFSNGDTFGYAIRLWWDGTTGLLRLQCFNTSGVQIISIVTPSPLPLNAWASVAIERDGNLFTLYVNGVAVASASSSADLRLYTGTNQCYSFGTAYHFTEARDTMKARYHGANYTPQSAAWPNVTCVVVPNVVGQSQATATSNITGAGLVLGTVTMAADPIVPAGDVISQSPVGGTNATAGDPVNITVSTGPASTTVPDVEGLTLSAATVLILGATLVVGTVTSVHNNVVAAGLVISQDPAAGASVPAGDAVDMVLSLGPGGPIPNVVGFDQTTAATILTTDGFVLGTIGTAFNPTFPIDDIVSQNPTAGTDAAAGTAVDVILSLGPEGIEVPNVVNSSLEDATLIIVGVGLIVGALSNGYSEDVPAGAVMQQSPLAGSRLLPGQPVNLVISLGPEAVSVPNVVGLTSSNAAEVLRAAGLRVGRITVDTSGATPLGLIAAQFANAGALVPSGTKIALVLSAIAPPFEVGATVISQYAQSPTLIELVESMAEYIDPRINLTEFYAYVWNVDTATGFGLDVWGKIVGVGRLLRIVADDPIFGFDNASTPPPDWQPFGEGRFARNTGEGGEAVILPDDAYRILILTKALANIASTSSAAINQLLRNLFPGRGKAYVEDLGGMEMRFVFDFALTPVEYAIVSQSGALPHPAGVALSVSVPP